METNANLIQLCIILWLALIALGNYLLTYSGNFDAMVSKVTDTKYCPQGVFAFGYFLILIFLIPFTIPSSIHKIRSKKRGKK